MNWELDSILEQSISQIAEGQARVESCLLAYPAQAAELEPLLRASEELRVIPKPVMSPAAKARIESQLFEAAAASGLVRRERKPLLALLRPLIVLPRWRWAYSALAAVVVVLLLMTTLVGAANALPGSPLYPIKLATEEVWLWVTPVRAEPALHLRLAQRRLDEYKKLVERGVYDESVLEAMVAQVDAALEDIEALPPALALVLLDEVEEVVAEQQRVLTGLFADLPVESQQKVNSILGDTLVQITRIGAMRTVSFPYETGVSPEPTLTDVPVGTSEPGETLVATSTSTSVLTPEETEEVTVPTSTATSGGTEPSEATSTSAVQPTTSVPTATPVPPATATPTSPTPETPPTPTPTKKTPPGLTKTPLPPGIVTRTPNP
jgi:hypothetical protein